MIDVDKCKSAMIAAASRDPMRAEYPPEWDADGIEEDFVEKRSKELYDTIIASPDDMAEMLQEFTGDEAGQLLFDLCKNLGKLISSDTALAPVAHNVKLSLDSMINEYTIQQAQREIDNA